MRLFASQPKGLSVLAGTAVWNNFSFFGTSALLLLFLQDSLLPRASHVFGLVELRALVESITGPMDDAAFGAQIVGLFVGLVYFAPLPGGALADRVLGRDRAVTFGALMMMAGHLLLAFEPLFLIGLLCLGLGSGLFEPNLAAQVGDLYSPEDSRRDRGFYIYYASINVGAVVAPLVVGTLGERIGYHLGFATAALGMAVALLTHRRFRGALPATARVDKVERRKLLPAERRALWRLGAIGLVLVGFRVVYWQQATAFVFWVREMTDRTVGTFEIPVTWFQSLNPFFVIVLGPPLMLLWARRDPSPITKMQIGCMLGALSSVVLGLVALSLNGGGGAHWLWSVFYFLTLTAGELFTLPVGLALFGSSPAPVRSRMVGLWYVVSSAGGILGGALAGLWTPLGPSMFWFVLAMIATATCIALGLFGRGAVLGTADALSDPNCSATG